MTRDALRFELHSNRPASATWCSMSLWSLRRKGYSATQEEFSRDRGLDGGAKGTRSAGVAKTLAKEDLVSIERFRVEVR